MKKTLITFFIFISLSVNLFSQQDIYNEIMHYEPTKSDVISRGRNLILDEFLGDNVSKVEDTFLYLLNNVEDNDYSAFYPGEKIILACWTRHYDIALDEVLRLDSFWMLPPYERHRTIITPSDDLLWSKILEKSYLYIESVYRNINNSELEKEEKSVLTILVKDMLENQSGMPEELKKQDEINNLSTTFLETYSDSRYEHFIRNYVRMEYKPSNWGYGFEFLLGYVTPTGKSADYVTPGGSFGIAFDFSYKRFTLLLLDQINFAQKTKCDIPLDSYTTWAEGSKTSSLLVHAALGYRIVDNKQLSILPFAGVAGVLLDPTEYDIKEFPELKNKGLSTFAYVAGLNFDYKLNSRKQHPADYSYSALRIKLAYYFPQSNNVAMQGDVFSISVGFGGFTRKSKRVL